MRVFNRHFLLGVLFVTALAYAMQSKATCSPSNVSGGSNCVASNGSNSPNQGQAQQQHLDNANTNTNSLSALGGTGGAGGAGGAGGHASSRASAGAASRSASSVGNTSASASGGSATSTASNGGNVQSTTDVVQRSAPSVSLGIIAPNGCGAGAQGGGSNTRGAMMAGFAWTTDECYAFILAQSYQAIGQLKAACELLNTTNAAARAKKRGFALPSCEPEVHEVTKVVTSQFPGTYTQEQVDAIVRKAVSK